MLNMEKLYEVSHVLKIVPCESFLKGVWTPIIDFELEVKKV